MKYITGRRVRSSFTCLFIALAAIGCDAGKHVEKEEIKISNATEVQSRKCPDGSLPQVLKGVCSGVWEFKKTPKGDRCVFNWGPKITCMAGTKSMTEAAACYGVTEKPVLNSDMITNADQCLARFTAHPLIFHYELLCCPV